MKSDQSEDSTMVSGMAGLLLGLVVVLFLKLAHPEFFELSISGLIAIGLIIGCGILGMLVEQHIAFR